MITLNFYLNGFVINDHASDEVCAVISYASSSCINNCLIYDNEIESCKSEGLTYMIFDDSEEINDNVIEIYCLFRANLINWCNDVYSKEVKINEFRQRISLEE